jgi:adenine-specific DNA methylase
LEYCWDPFEIRVAHKNGKPTSVKVYGLSALLGHDVAGTYAEFREGKPLYLSCGDSAKTDLHPESVDAVVTDPPFFDNVHYSQLADFFYVWQRHILGGNGHHAAETTRSEAEVQQSDPATFTERLCGVWKECRRVLRRDGLLVFTYHHSRPEGWRSILEATVGAGFEIVAAHPIKAEMSVAQPKHQAKEPIDLDVILVCRKREARRGEPPELETLLGSAQEEAGEQIARLNATGRTLSRNDIRVVLAAQIIKRLSQCDPAAATLRFLETEETAIERGIGRLHSGQRPGRQPAKTPGQQLALW